MAYNNVSIANTVQKINTAEAKGKRRLQITPQAVDVGNVTLLIIFVVEVVSAFIFIIVVVWPHNTPEEYFECTHMQPSKGGYQICRCKALARVARVLFA